MVFCTTCRKATGTQGPTALERPLVSSFERLKPLQSENNMGWGRLLTLLVVVVVSSVEVQILFPQHLALLRQSEIGVDVGVSFASESELEIYRTSSLCLHVNGKRQKCVSTTTGGLAIPASALVPGRRTWMHVELLREEDETDTRVGVASAPVAFRVEEGTPSDKTLSDKTLSEDTDDRPFFSRLTAVLTVTLDDAHRAMVSAHALAALTVSFRCSWDLYRPMRAQRPSRRCVPTCSLATIYFAQLILVVPDAHAFAFEAVFARPASSAALSRRRVVPESSLFASFQGARWDTYALQMALKLLVARIVRTDYYVTFDADVVATGPLCLGALLPAGKGAYTPEPRSIHPHWWDGSATLLGLPPSAFPEATFGVRFLSLLIL